MNSKTQTEVEPTVQQEAEIVKESEAKSPQAVVRHRTRSNLWQPGKSANPNGKPKVIREITLLAREYTTQAIDTLAKIMQSRKSNDSARVRAAEILLERGYGKAQQTINIIQHLNSEELENAARRILLKRERLHQIEAKTVDAVVVDVKIEPAKKP